MPISKKWSQATASNIKEKAPEKGGVYELKNFGKLVYIGRASNLKSRLLTHNSERQPNCFRFKRAKGFFTTAKKLEDKHFTQYEEKHDSLPVWNNNDTR